MAGAIHSLVGTWAVAMRPDQAFLKYREYTLGMENASVKALALKAAAQADTESEENSEYQLLRAVQEAYRSKAEQHKEAVVAFASMGPAFSIVLFFDRCSFAMGLSRLSNQREMKAILIAAQ